MPTYASLSKPDIGQFWLYITNKIEYPFRPKLLEKSASPMEPPKKLYWANKMDKRLS